MELTNDQKNVFDQVLMRLGGGNNSSQFNPDFDYLTIGGYAGTGKTFLISILRKEINERWKYKRVAFVSFTGKASSVLSKKLIENKVVFKNDFCGTIHSLIYRPEVKYDNKTHRMVVVRWVKKIDIKEDYDLIFIDESSMINKELWNDLSEFGIPIIAVGDHGQLPPIGDNFGLMTNPQYILTEIKRQSLDNPLIKLSQEIRMGKNIPLGLYDNNSKKVFKLDWKNKECQTLFNKIEFNDENIIILCGFNKTRVSLNQTIRSKLGFNSPEAYPGERVVCLKNNHYNKVMNGMLGTVLFVMQEAKNLYNMDIKMDGFPKIYSGLVYNGCFGKEQYTEGMDEIYNNNKKYKKILKNTNFDQIDLFDFGYCISVHKSQGSEWDKVVLFDEWMKFDQDFYKRWLYTGCTRAKEKLFVIS